MSKSQLRYRLPLNHDTNKISTIENGWMDGWMHWLTEKKCMLDIFFKSINYKNCETSSIYTATVSPYNGHLTVTLMHFPIILMVIREMETNVNRTHGESPRLSLSTGVTSSSSWFPLSVPLLMWKSYKSGEKCMSCMYVSKWKWQITFIKKKIKKTWLALAGPPKNDVAGQNWRAGIEFDTSVFEAK